MAEKREANEVFSSPAEEHIKKSKQFKTSPHEEQQAQNTRIGDDFDFEIPIEIVPLPSEGKVYALGTTLCNKTELEISSLTAREEDILTSEALIKQGTMIEHLLKSCITDKTVNVNSMLLGDRLALLIAIRATGYGAEYSVEATCPACKQKFKATFNLATLPIKHLTIEPIEEFSNKFSFMLPVIKKNVIFKFLNGNDERELALAIERKKNVSAIGSSVTTRLIYQIEAIGNVSDKGRIAQIVRKLPALDSLKLRTYIDDNEPGIDTTSHAQCNSCGWYGEVDVPLGAEFFWPSGK